MDSLKLQIDRCLLFYIFVLIIVCLPQQIFARDSIKQIVIFGDSYSDSGNTFKKSSNTYPGRAYFLGRFTNGFIWSEYLAIKLGKNITDANVYRNYAYGQAQLYGQIELTTHTDGKEWSLTIPDLSKQVDDYINDINISPLELPLSNRTTKIISH